MAADTCEACGVGTVAMDTVYGILACDNCGRVFDDVETYLGAHHQAGLVMERGGTFVKSTESGALAACGLGGSIFRSANRDDANKREVLSKMRETSAILRVPLEKVDDVKHMLERLLEGEWGQGRWVDVLVAACIYVAIRQSRLPLTLVEVASSVDCGIVELGRMYRRVLDALHLELPDTDPHVFMERALASLTRSKGLSRDLSRAMARQGALLLDCSRHWFITTGRRPLPVVAAVIALVAEAHQLKLEFEDVVRELYSHPRTSRMRLAELREALVGVGQKLPWGGDITVKTLEKHLPFLLKFLEVDVKRARKKTLQLECGKDYFKDTSTTGRQPGPTTGATAGATTGTQTRGTTASTTGATPGATTESQSPARTGATIGRQSPATQHGGSVELRLVEALKRKEVEWQAWPKSFLVGADAHARRCGKIRAAMERIHLAKQGLLSRVDKKRRKVELPQETNCELDWEDLVIEYLLLRGVEQTQLEDGYYRAALGVHHMQSTEQIDDDELVPYLRSKAEVKMLKSLHDVEDASLLTQPL